MCAVREKSCRPEAAADGKDLTISSLLPIIVNSGYIGIQDVGRLARTNSAMNTFIMDNENIWASLCNRMYQKYEMTHVLPKEVIDNRGHRWFVRKFLKNTVSENPSILPLSAPTHNENDFVLFGDLSYNPDKSNNEFHKVGRGFSIAGGKLRPLLTDGKVDISLSDPITVADAMRSDQIFRYPDHIPVCPTECHLKSMKLRVCLLRLRDMKSCCVYEPNTTEPMFGKYPMLRPLDRTINTLHFNKLSNDDLDFQTDTIAGHINMFDGAADQGRWFEGEERGLPLQDSAGANSITLRFPYLFSFYSDVAINVSLDKKIVITGFSLEARKKLLHDAEWLSIAFYDETPIGIEDTSCSNNGVTVAHIMSELHCPDDSDDISTDTRDDHEENDSIRDYSRVNS